MLPPGSSTGCCPTTPTLPAGTSVSTSPVLVSVATMCRPSSRSARAPSLPLWKKRMRYEKASCGTGSAIAASGPPACAAGPPAMMAPSNPAEISTRTPSGVVADVCMTGRPPLPGAASWRR